MKFISFVVSFLYLALISYQKPLSYTAEPAQQVFRQDTTYKNYVNFKRNSTIFVKGEKAFLENAIAFIKTIESDWDTLVITAHNSSIERNKDILCNKILAKMERILVKNGIQESIIQAEVKTDTELRNRCKKGVACIKEEHQINQNVTLRLK